MMDLVKIPNELITVCGSGGGDDEPETYVPVEAANSLQSNTIAQIVAVLAEGEIEGPANNGDWYKSCYLNETQLKADDGTMNFEGVTLYANTGTSDQDALPGADRIEAETSVDTLVEKSVGPVARTITNSAIEDVRVTLEVPSLFSQTDKGDINETSVNYQVTITPDNGAGVEQLAINGVLSGKCVSPYRESRLIRNLFSFGSAPWVMKIYRITNDSTSSKLQDSFKFYSYTEIINAKLRHPDTAMASMMINSKLFGNRLPSISFKLKGRKINYPSNYDPVTRTYDGIWDGTFNYGYCNNPAWVTYDIAVNDRFGVGLAVTSTDKWALYTIGKYCDGTVSYTHKVQNTDGSYSSSSIDEPRYQFNGLIQDRGHAIEVLNHMCSVFMGFPIWSSGMLSFVQDSPREITRKAHPGNVKDGFFDYPGTSKSTRTTVVNVTYSDPDNFGRPVTIPIVDQAGVARYGYNPTSVVAFGCYSPGEAVRRAKFVLESNLGQTQQISFTGIMEWADCIPGEITGVQDPDYALKNLYGRITASTATSITADKDIEIENGVTYKIHIPDTETKTLHQRVLTNSPGTTRNLTWSGDITPVPEPGFDFIIDSTSVALRQFEVLGISESSENAIEHAVTGLIYDPDKYARIEQDIVVEAPVKTTVTGKLAPPTNLKIQPYAYTEGDSAVRKYGLLISWQPSEDPRTLIYELAASYNGGGWSPLKPPTAQNSFDYRDIPGGTYDLCVRAKGPGGVSVWVYKMDYVMVADLDNPAPPTNLHCKDDPVNEYFKGPDCEITWDASIGSNYNIDADADVPYDGAVEVGTSNVIGYKIEVYDGTDLVRTHISEGRDVLSWVYTLAMNAEDNGSPIRNINFRVYTLAMGDLASLTYASLSASNPAPSMASVIPTILSMPAHIDISWTTITTDNDMLGYEVWIDGIKEKTIPHPDSNYKYPDVEVGTSYTVQIVPLDYFGPGTGSQTNSGSPIKIPAINLDVELSASMEKTDSDGNTAATLERLYDGIKGANGVSYTLSGIDKYIQYKFGLEDYIDRMGIWTADANAHVYFAISTDGSNWTWLKADTDHTVDSGSLTVATNQADAITNYLQLAAGENLALLPNNMVAKYARLYMTGTYSTTIYEFIPNRILISELAAIASLSSLTVNAGLLKAGVLESTTRTTSGNNPRVKFDLNNAVLKTFNDNDVAVVELGELS